MLVAATNDLPGHRIVRHIGLVRGITARSRNLVANIGGGLQSLFGGNVSIYTDLAEQASQEAHDLLVQHAASKGANAVIAMRYNANEIMDGINEVLADGAAVWVEPAPE